MERQNRHRKIIAAIELNTASRAERFARLKKLFDAIGQKNSTTPTETALTQIAGELGMTFDQVAAVYQLFSGWPPEEKNKMTTAARAATAIREVPEHMWDRIAVMRHECQTLTEPELREKTAAIGKTFGFSEAEMVQRHIITAVEKFTPKPGALKGARRA